MAEHEDESKLLACVRSDRRQFVRDLVRGGFAIPAMASFSMSALQVATLGAQAPHGS